MSPMHTLGCLVRCTAGRRRALMEIDDALQVAEQSSEVIAVLLLRALLRERRGSDVTPSAARSPENLAPRWSFESVTA